jgi:hypothetical protein
MMPCQLKNASDITFAFGVILPEGHGSWQFPQ